MLTERRPEQGQALVEYALILALMKEAEDEGVVTKKLQLIAAKLVEKALAGDLSAIKEIFDRVDGRPTQPDAAEDMPPDARPMRVVIVDPKNPDDPHPGT